MSMDTTTEEIDIDAVLGYPDIAEEPELEREHEMDQQVQSNENFFCLCQ